jgi:hypothetical protein
MANKNRKMTALGLALCLPLLSACGILSPNSTPTPTPTLDLNPIRTEVAATIFVQVSQTSVAVPTATPIPSPILTLASTSTPTQAAITPTSLTATAIITGTPELGAKNLAQWVSQSISDGTVFEPGEAFTITWRLKNVGESTWTAAYILRYYSGETFGAPKEILLGKIVLPGDTVDISIPMKAPVRSGDYRTDWVLANENRSNFKDPVFLKITVAAPATSTPTATKAPETTQTSSP